MSEHSFGELASTLSTSNSLRALEVRHGRAHLFAEVDALLVAVAVFALKGQPTVSVERRRQGDNVSLNGLEPSHQATLDEFFSVEKQHRRGAWFLPEQVSLRTGLVNLPATFARHPRFATGMTWEDRARVVLADSPGGVFLWGVLEPLFEQLFLPFELRGRLVGTKSRDDQLAAWASADELASALCFNVETELAVMRYGGGWSRLRAAEQLEAKQHLLAALAAQASEEMGGRYRAYRLRPLIARYYSKAKNGRATRKQVLNRALEKTLSGFYGGDWLSFLRYLGEEPHPDEEVAEAIPETRLFVGGTKTPASVASEKGVAVEEVERVISTYWETAGGPTVRAASPVEQRVDVLRAFWQHFDEIHSRQEPGMPSLWGLVEENRRVWIGWEGPDWYHPRLYRKLLPNDLLNNVERLWGTNMLPRWPDRIVTEIMPHGVMAEAFGPALKFWNGCALTAWFVCEGPMSRTDMAGLAGYHQDALAALEGLATPVNPALFAELREAEASLGPAEPIDEQVSSVEVRPGLSVQMRLSNRSRRSGFERLRDIITRYRRAWTHQYEQLYLRARWESELHEAARLHSQMIAENGKPPTPRQFARHAAAATNHWFGGDLNAFYAAIGEKSRIHPVRVSRMPPDRLGFARTVFQNLGGRPFERKIFVSSSEEGRAQNEERDMERKLGWLAEESLHFIQLEEALGRPPNLKEFGPGGFEYRAVVLAPETDRAWATYVRAIRTASEDPSSPMQGPRIVIDKKSATAATDPGRGPASSPPYPDGGTGKPSAPDRRSWIGRLLGR